MGQHSGDGGSWGALMGENAGGKLGGSEAADGGCGREPAKGGMMAGSSEAYEALAEEPHCLKRD